MSFPPFLLPPSYMVDRVISLLIEMLPHIEEFIDLIMIVSHCLFVWWAEHLLVRWTDGLLILRIQTHFNGVVVF